ncbi:N-acetylmannosamine-6-phosphate 2-epimerase [Clostridium sp. HCS.1]|uniref:N-acetylmannosamine-6-phosphate 2-epimerase n=1 Tax=Clostridium sp. HCS.1 TaxID=3238594 RepID=UPI003A0FF860
MKNINKGLIVSCQALEDEPLHSSFIMGKMAKAAIQGGAIGIRANSKEDIIEIKRSVDTPIIGIVKRDYEDSDIYITPTMREVDELMEAGVDIIALDATNRLRPDNTTLEVFIEKIREKYNDILLMADCSTYEEAINANKLGFDFIGTTLVGYTEESKGIHINDNDFELIRNIINSVSKPVIAEGNIDTPEKARRVLELGCYSVVVGSIITRPQVITKKFINEINKIGEY